MNVWESSRYGFALASLCYSETKGYGNCEDMMTDVDVQTTLSELAGTDPHAQRQARKLISQSDDSRFVHGLVDLLDSADEYLQRECITLLGKIGNDQAVPRLTELLNHQSIHDELQEDVIIALGRIGDDRAESSLLQLADSENIYIRQRIAKALGSFTSEQSIQTLTILLDDDNNDVRANSAQALGDIGNPNVIPALDNALDDVVWTVRKQAVSALAQFDDEAIVEPMLYALEDIRSPIRIIAAEKLGELGTPLAYEPLLQARHPFRRDVNTAIDTALEKLDGKYVRDPDMDITLLIDLLPIHHKPEVIAQTLETIGTPTALAAVDAWRTQQPSQ
jgi:HEAT repeat protein